MSIFSNPKDAAAANAGQVVQALLDLLGDRPPLEVLAETPGWLTGRLAEQAPAALRRPEAPGKWSVAAVVAHLADTEMVVGVRSRFTVGDLEPPLPGFDQDRWAAEFRYLEADPAESLATFRAVRESNLRHWNGLDAGQWRRVGHHSERGPVSADLNARITAGHDLVHRRQIDRILGAAGV